MCGRGGCRLLEEFGGTGRGMPGGKVVTKPCSHQKRTGATPTLCVIMPPADQLLFMAETVHECWIYCEFLEVCWWGLESFGGGGVQEARGLTLTM